MQETFQNQKHDFLHRGYLKHHSNSACSSMHSDWKGLSNLRERSSNCPCDTKITVMGDKMLITLGTLKNRATNRDVLLLATLRYLELTISILPSQ